MNEYENKILLMDTMEFLSKLPDNSMDCCITDPPYNISGYDNKKKIGWLESNSYWTEKKKFTKIDEKWDKFNNIEYEDFMYMVIQEIKRVVKPNGNIAIFGTYHNIYKIGYIIDKLELKIQNSIIWFKRNAFPNLTQRMYCESTEQIIWAVNNSHKHAKNWTFNYKVMKEMNGGKQMRNMWDITNTPPKQKKFGKHPSQKNELVIDRLVLALTNEGDIILDPFMGSGTTAASAKRLRRKYTGCDNNKEYIDICTNRLNNVVPEENKIKGVVD